MPYARRTTWRPSALAVGIAFSLACWALGVLIVYDFARAL